MNGLLLKRYKISYYRGQPRGFATLPKGHVFKVMIPPKTRKQQYQYVIQLDASVFILSLYQQFSVTIWSSCTKHNLTTSLIECFSVDLVDLPPIKFLFDTSCLSLCIVQ